MRWHVNYISPDASKFAHRYRSLCRQAVEFVHQPINLPIRRLNPPLNDVSLVVGGASASPVRAKCDSPGRSPGDTFP